MIFQFDDYRDYLKEYIRRLPKQGHGEAKRIAAHLRVSSTFISHVLGGTKQLTPEQGLLLSQYLGLSPLDAEYFFFLVQEDRAGNSELKKYCRLKLEETKRRANQLVNRVEAKKSMTEREKSIFYSNAIYSAIHTYCSTSERGRTLDEISKRFDLPRILTGEMLNFLVEAKLCSQDDQHYQIGTQSTHLEFSSPFLLKHHTNWRLRAIQAAEDLGESELMYTVNVSISRKDFAFLREEMVVFIQKFLAKVHPSRPDEIANFNLDWFWIRR